MVRPIIQLNLDLLVICSFLHRDEIQLPNAESEEYKTGNAISLNKLILRDLEILAYREVSSNCFYGNAFVKDNSVLGIISSQN